MNQNLSENNKFYGFGKALLMIGTLVTFVCGAFLLGVYKYEPTLMVASGMIILFIGLVILLLGLLMVNVKDECFFKASGWVYMSFGLVLFLLTLLALFRLVLALFGSRENAVAAVILYQAEFGDDWRKVV